MGSMRNRRYPVARYLAYNSHTRVSLPFCLFSTICLTMSAVSAPASPVSHAFPHIQWDALTSLRLTAQETALLRMAETNPIDYTLADSRVASMYARVLLKLLAEACSAGAGTGKSHLNICCIIHVRFHQSNMVRCRRSIDVHRQVYRRTSHDGFGLGPSWSCHALRVD